MGDFAISEVLPGKLNTLVENLMRQMNINDPNEAVRRINSGEWNVFKKSNDWRAMSYLEVSSHGVTGP